MNQLGRLGDSRSVSSGQVTVTCGGSSSGFNPSSLLFPLSDSGFASFSPAASSLGLSSSSTSSSFGLSAVAPSLPPSSLPVFSLPSVVLFILAVSSSAPALVSVSLAPPPGFPPGVPSSSGISSSFPPLQAPLSAPLFPSAPLSVPTVRCCLLCLLCCFLLLVCVFFCLHFWGIRFGSGACFEFVCRVSGGRLLVCAVRRVRFFVLSFLALSSSFL